VQRLVDSRVESGLHVRLELIYELPESFKKVVVSHRFEPKFQLHASQLFPHSTFVDAVTGCIVIAMQDVGDYGFRHEKLCAGQSGGK